MNSKSKSDEISPAVTSDGSNLFTLFTRKVLCSLHMIHCKQSVVRRYNSTFWPIHTKHTPSIQQTSCSKIYMPLFPVSQPKRNTPSARASLHETVGRLLLQMHFNMMPSLPRCTNQLLRSYDGILHLIDFC